MLLSTNTTILTRAEQNCMLNIVSTHFHNVQIYSYYDVYPNAHDINVDVLQIEIENTKFLLMNICMCICIHSVCDTFSLINKPAYI